jgi:hypothetical protein
VYSGRDTYPMTFTVSNGVITDLHGTIPMYCAGGPNSVEQTHPFSDGNSIDIDSDGSFSDDYRYAVGNGTGTLHVEGKLTDQGNATGFVDVQGVGCSAGRNGWAAALPDAELPTAPSSPAASAAVPCSPQPCQTHDGVTISVQSTSLVTKSDDSSTQAVDVAFTVVNDGDNPELIRSNDFTMNFGNGDVATPISLDFVDSSGQPVPCLRGQQTVAPGQQLEDQHLCLTLPREETGQSMTLVGAILGPAFTIALGTLQ